MNDLKDFWDEEERLATIALKFNKDALHIVKSLREKQGLFFWERCGKQFVLDRNRVYGGSNELKDIVEDAQGVIDCAVELNELDARDFLDAVKCDEKKVKELIKELKVKE